MTERRARRGERPATTGPSRAAPGFTLVELLVVLGVIAVLAGLLLPALGRSQEAGRATACLGHLRNLLTLEGGP